MVVVVPPPGVCFAVFHPRVNELVWCDREGEEVIDVKHGVGIDTGA